MRAGQQSFLLALLFLADLHFTAGHRITTRRYLIYGANVLRPCNEFFARLYDVLFFLPFGFWAAIVMKADKENGFLLVFLALDVGCIDAKSESDAYVFLWRHVDMMFGQDERRCVELWKRQDGHNVAI
ncbi:hypothetical protein J3459_008526 [Metarhizium acridum]|uniref:uncharacterized protein n=1 Tax=Metarhizium acridum TaxID=92637 RepID=UPI001C6D0AB1|nr:hypothetical protein J3458_000565 [Metarhizium acridum]KAG8426023.1 hypothetical protein J3459_008526 [Metarhizium acridum]